MKIHISAHPFVQGYWACYFNLPCPPDASDEFRKGWDECDDELRWEREQEVEL